MSWDWLWGGGRSESPTGRHVLFYTRRGCPLCDEAWQIVAAAQGRYGFTLEKVDVDAEPALAAQYGECVPVVAIDGKVRFRGRVNRILLERMLRAPAGDGSGASH